jgi:iron complex transport system ATP-binding protein
MLAALDIHLPGRLAGVSLAVRPGQVTAVCGPNGAGKSSLLEVLAGLLEPAAGQVLLDDRQMAGLGHRKRAQRIGYLPQAGEAAWNLSVRTLAGLGRLPHSTGVAEDRRSVDAALTALELAPLADRPIATLSGGERARAMLARVLAGEPQVILADEPLANLDLAHQAVLLGHLRALAAEGRSVVLVLHDLAAAMNHADQVIVLDKGKVAASGAPNEALSAEVIGRVWGVRAEWLGSPGAMALAV